jgi:hypothetical protein
MTYNTNHIDHSSDPVRDRLPVEADTPDPNTDKWAGTLVVEFIAEVTDSTPRTPSTTQRL